MAAIKPKARDSDYQNRHANTFKARLEAEAVGVGRGVINNLAYGLHT